jgi:signal transduction histidine kinase
MTMELVSTHSFYLSFRQDPPGFGLQTMRERVVQIGGQMIVESHPGGGTTLAFQIPVEVIG